MYVFDPKDPSDVDSFDVKFGQVLTGGDTIASRTVVKLTGDATLGVITNSANVVTFWLSGGTPGTDTVLDVTIVSAAGRTIQRQVTVPIRTL